MRTFSSFNHSGPDEVPIAILLRQTALKASVGSDPIERRPSSGGHPGWAIPHGTLPLYAIGLIQGWARRKRAFCPPYGFRITKATRPIALRSINSRIAFA